MREKKKEKQVDKQMSRIKKKKCCGVEIIAEMNLQNNTESIYGNKP